MVDMKRIRESLGHTHEKQIANVSAWYSLAKSFHAAASVLNNNQELIPSDSRPFAFNAAFSLELILKAILAQKGLPIPDGADGHNLRSLCVKAKVNISDKQMHTLELQTEEIIWAGRYPTPKTEKRFDDFHDKIIEKHIVRSATGNVTSVIANRETFPTWENYLNIWNLCVAELGFCN
ncbi:MAG: hypothetical protein WA743_06975 [Pseudolabrys sp.]|jgi:HEPN domain-containing protein